MRDEIDSEAARLYPSYKLGDGGIAEKEYEAAVQATANEERIYSTTSAILGLLAPVVASLAWGGLDNAFNSFSSLTQTAEAAAVVIIVTAIAAYFALAHLTNLRRNYVYAARKLIVLRRMLGQSYGHSHLVLPPWRLEGADIPYAIRMFPGWRV